MLVCQTISEIVRNPNAVRDVPAPFLAAWLGRNAPNKVRRLLNQCPQHQATPLRKLNELANILRLNAIYAKDESDRLGLGSFKALGGAYAVAELVLGWSTETLG